MPKQNKQTERRDRLVTQNKKKDKKRKKTENWTDVKQRGEGDYKSELKHTKKNLLVGSICEDAITSPKDTLSPFGPG